VIVAVVVMATTTAPTTVITVVIITVWELNVGVSSMATAPAPTTVITVVIITVWELNVGVSSRRAFGRDTMDADVDSGCGRLGFRAADCLGDGYEFFLVRTVKLLEISFGHGVCGSCIPSGGCLPFGSLLHTPSSGGVQGRGSS
jgi:hypothetical protein